MTYTNKNWSETKGDLSDCFVKWTRASGKSIPWAIEANSTRYLAQLEKDERRVTLTYKSPIDGLDKRLECDQFPRIVDNARAIYLTVDAIRLQDYRGLSGLMAQAYTLLPAKAESLQTSGWTLDGVAMDPYKVLGVDKDAPLDVINAAYRANAKKFANDVLATKALNISFDAIKAERGL